MNRLAASMAALTLAATALPAMAADFPLVAGNAAIMSGQTLAGARGHIAVNQAAGERNLQANVFQFGLPMGQPADSALMQKNTATTGLSPQGDGNPSAAHVGSGSDVLFGASGVVQVNQTAGSGNVTGNVVRVGFQ